MLSTGTAPRAHAARPMGCASPATGAAGHRALVCVFPEVKCGGGEKLVLLTTMSLGLLQAVKAARLLEDEHARQAWPQEHRLRV